MKAVIPSAVQDVIKAVHYHPAVSIILPFEPKMSLKAELSQYLNSIADKVERLIRRDYDDDLSELVIGKLRSIVRQVDFSSFKKSIAIYVSPVFEKVFYLDIEVEEKIIIDESFEIRDLVLARKDSKKYLVLSLNAHQSSVFFFDGETFRKIKSNVPESSFAFTRDLPGRIANFSDPHEHKEQILKKFLHDTDLGLGLLLRFYPFPVFVTGTPKALGYFKSLTQHSKQILNYVVGNHENITGCELERVMAPYVHDWKKLNDQKLKQQISAAAGNGKLAIGISEVCKQVARHRGQLLIVEKNFMVQSERTGNAEKICKPVAPYNKFSCVKDAVDDLIEKVLLDGGDVEFVDDGMLNEHDHIVLIQYY